jgi:hypothetical protein
MSEKKVDVKAEQYEKIRRALVDGEIRALSIDTCIFTYAGYQLEAGNLKRLNQFKDNELKLVFSEVTLRELLNHLILHADEAKAKTITALRNCGKFWGVSKEVQDSTLIDLLGEGDAASHVEERLKIFLEKSGAQRLNTTKLMNVERLLAMYFDSAAPFENTKEKKSEFPDAIALITLEAWARKTGTALLFVTNDKGCQRFCSKSDVLYSISDLGQALTLVQERDAHVANLCAMLDERIAARKFPDFIEDIRSAVENNIWKIDWIVDADSAFYFEPDLNDVELINLVLTGADGEAELSPVDFGSGLLVARATVVAHIEATCDFSFSVHDSIDHEMVAIGSTEARAKESIEIDLLLTFAIADGAEPTLEEVEVVPGRRIIQFGSVEPNYDAEQYEDN